MGKSYKRIEDLYDHIRKSVTKGMKEDVEFEVKNTMVENIEEHVYEAYDPKYYERRGSWGGLIDFENIYGQMIDEYTLKVRNIREDEDSGKDVAYTVETGQGYSFREDNGYNTKDYKNRTYEKPRPFTQKTIETLQNEKRHVKALKSYMGKQGYDIK